MFLLGGMMKGSTLHLGDCLEYARTLPADHLDAIVTDPPYGLEFMGQEWDRGVPGIEFWREFLRVAKPGAHLLAFGGTRTFHRMACAIEDAGWEIRDTVMWVYGSGFPKSLDVSKAIDKMDASEEQNKRRLRFTAWVRSQGVTASQINTATQTNMGGHYTASASQPSIMTREHLEACRGLFRDVPEWVERECDIRSVESRNMAEREVVGTRVGVDTTKQVIACPTSFQGLERSTRKECAITAPATDAAREWAGWGTALKPAWEPIIVARKPLEGTVAANVLRYGTGGINVDGCRVAAPAGDSANGRVWTSRPSAFRDGTVGFVTSQKDGDRSPPIDFTEKGRWPANLIHDGSPEVLTGFPERGAAGVAVNRHRGERKPSTVNYATHNGEDCGFHDSGSAARFFYCAKASRAERGEGNVHPTVKPVALMRYLCRLVTPPGGTVFDPFMGSGSTGVAAVLEGFGFVGCELSPEYLEIAQARIGNAGGQLPLF